MLVHNMEPHHSQPFYQWLHEKGDDRADQQGGRDSAPTEVPGYLQEALPDKFWRDSTNGYPDCKQQRVNDARTDGGGASRGHGAEWVSPNAVFAFGQRFLFFG